MSVTIVAMVNGPGKQFLSLSDDGFGRWFHMFFFLDHNWNEINDSQVRGKHWECLPDSGFQTLPNLSHSFNDKPAGDDVRTFEDFFNFFLISCFTLISIIPTIAYFIV